MARFNRKLVSRTVGCACLWMFTLGVGEVQAEDPAVVFVSRTLEPANEPREEAISRASEGSLIVRNSDGSLRTLVGPGAAEGAGLADVQAPDVSYDGQRIVFSGYTAASENEDEGGWRIWEIQASGEGLRQVTFTDGNRDVGVHGEAATILAGHDDVDPCYLPDGRICFVSTRYPGVAPDSRVRTTNLYVVELDGSDLHRITTERFGADTPTVGPDTGQIIYSRWWRSLQDPTLDRGSNAVDGPVLPIPPGSPGYGAVGGGERTGVDFDQLLSGVDEADFPGVNNWFLASINPDGSGMKMHSGFGLDRQTTQAWRPSPLANGSLASLFIPVTPFLGLPRGNGLRLLPSGNGEPISLGGPQTFVEANAAGGFLFAGAVEFTADRLIASVARLDQPLDYDLYFVDAGNGTLEPMLQIESSAQLDPVVLSARELPPIVDDSGGERLSEFVPTSVEEAYERGGSFIFEVANIHGNAAVDEPIANAPPIGEPLAIEFYMAPQGTSTNATDPPFLVHRQAIGADGRVRVSLPAGVPLFEVLRRQDGTIPVGRDGQIFHVGGMNFGGAGGHAKCVGCHAGHSMQDVAEESDDPTAGPVWTNVATSAVVRVSSERQARGEVEEFNAAALIDRRTTDAASTWQARDTDQVPSIELQWSVPIVAREVVLYAPRAPDGFGRQILTGVVVEALSDQGTTATVTTPALETEGTRISWDAQVEFDRLRIALPEYSGAFEEGSGAALAEIEVIGRTEHKASLFDGCGRISSWNILGPYQNTGGPAPSVAAMRRDYLADGDVTESTMDWYPGTRLRNNGQFMRTPRGDSPRVLGHTGSDGLVDLMQVFGSNVDNAMIYAQAWVTVSEDTSVRLAVSSDDSVQVLINGEEAWIHSIPRPLRGDCLPQDVSPEVTLRQGTNNLVVKIFEGRGMWAFSLRFQDRTGQLVTEGIEVSLFPPVPPLKSQRVERFVRGNADSSGAIDVTDAILTLSHLFLGEAAPPCLDAADTNDDGSLDISDPVALLFFSLLGGAQPPSPFPGCGIDETLDGLGCESFPGCVE